MSASPPIHTISLIKFCLKKKENEVNWNYSYREWLTNQPKNRKTTKSGQLVLGSQDIVCVCVWFLSSFGWTERKFSVPVSFLTRVWRELSRDNTLQNVVLQSCLISTLVFVSCKILSLFSVNKIPSSSKKNCWWEYQWAVLLKSRLTTFSSLIPIETVFVAESLSFRNYW